MPKAKLKINKTKKSVSAFINRIENSKRRSDANFVMELMKKITKKKPAIWGDRIVGFDDHTYKFSSGREVDYYIVGFTANKDRISIYVMASYKGMEDLFNKLGPHKKGAACLHIKDLDKIHKPTLKKIIERGYRIVKKGKKK